MNISSIQSPLPVFSTPTFRSPGRGITERDSFEDDSVAMSSSRRETRDEVRSIDEAFALVASLRSGILDNKEEALGAQANQARTGLSALLG